MSNAVARFRGRWKQSIAMIAAGPLLTWLSGYEPPWPEFWPGFQACSSITFSAVAVAIAIALCPSTTTAKWIGIASLIIGLGLCVVYVGATATHVEVLPQIVEGKTKTARFVVGNERLPGIENDLTNEELLKRYGRPESIWTKRSLIGPRWSLLMSFLFAFAFINFGLAAFSVAKSGDGALRPKKDKTEGSGIRPIEKGS